MEHILLVISTHCTLQKIDPSLRLVVDLERNMKAMQSPAYARKIKLTNLQQMAKTIAFLQENGIGSLEELSSLKTTVQEDYMAAHEALLKTDSRIRKVNILIRNYGQYLSHKQVYQDYLQAKNKQQFRSEHESELLLYEGARKVLKDEYGSSRFPALKTLTTEKQALQQERNRLYEEESIARRRLQEMNIIEKNVHAVLEISASEPERDSSEKSL